MTSAILAPAALLILWTLGMLGWMVATRVPELRKLAPEDVKHGARGQDLEGVIDERANWKAHNHTHLHEQPTLFYATVLILALVGFTAFDVLLAWLYVALRVAHSVWQARVNRVPQRTVLFAISTACLFILAARALVVALAG